MKESPVIALEISDAILVIDALEGYSEYLQLRQESAEDLADILRGLVEHHTKERDTDRSEAV